MRRAPLFSVASIAFSAAMAAILCSSACSDDKTSVAPPGNDSGTPDTSTGSSVTLAFEARVGSEPFKCTSTYSKLGTTKATLNITDFKLFVYDVRLVGKDGTETPVSLTQDQKWQYQNVALLDFEDRTGSCRNGTTDTNTKITGTVPPGEYRGVRFRLGLPPALNHGNATLAPAPLNDEELFWTWASGYKFLRIDSRAVRDDAGAGDAGTDDAGHGDMDAGDGGMNHGGNPLTFFVHLGSAGCKGEPQVGEKVTCTYRNVPDIDLPAFDPAKNKIVLDYAALVSENDVSGGGMCMSSPTEPRCVPIFKHLGLDIATGNPAPGQTTFRVE
ncbi:MbnP family copper-binding protein [Pendulispora albinea]|uniref:Metallo-mystery pair system four-Cys motif protein n=1 Tax=Pendulispora albinea TaxID=2741071 RepID=A0ABZ2LNI0_9BACT